MARLCLSPAARTTADATKRSLNVGFGILIFSTSAALSLLTIRGRSHITSDAGGGTPKADHCEMGRGGPGTPDFG